MEKQLEVKPVETESRELVAMAEAMVVKCDDDYDAAAEMMKACKAMQKRVEEFISPVVKPAHAAWKQAKDLENELVKPLKAALDHLGRVMGTYRAECERERREQEALQREAER